MGSEGLDHAEGAFTSFMVASGGILSEEYGHDGPGVCLGDGQTEAVARWLYRRKVVAATRCSGVSLSYLT